MEDSSKSDRLPLEVKIIYWIYDSVDKVGDEKWHKHDCWQIDLVKSGSAFMLFETEKLKLHPGDVIIIPPGLTHTVRHFGPYVNWSFKFELYNYDIQTDPVLIPSRKLNQTLWTSINAIVSDEFEEESEFFGKNTTIPEHFKDVVVLEYLLAGFVDRHLRCDGATGLISKRLRTLMSKRKSVKLKVEDAASELGYSRAHLNCLLKDEIGLSTKEFIDHERVKIAKRLLKYSEMNVSEVADRLEFDDPYRFSKFFRRIAGMPPGKYIKLNRG